MFLSAGFLCVGHFFISGCLHADAFTDDELTTGGRTVFVTVGFILELEDPLVSLVEFRTGLVTSTQNVL